MRTSAPIRFAAVASLAISSLLHAQSLTSPAKPLLSGPATLPANPPTAIPELPKTPGQLPPQQANVNYANGLVTVSASNSSLNQILRDISHQTGMKITGGVTDERVFGQYGPLPPSQVLTTLLDGTGSNILFLHGSGNTPPELILTPRQGGPTPPNPNAAALEEREQLEDRAPKQALRPGQLPPYQTTPQEHPAAVLPPETPAAETPAPATAPTSSDSSQQQSPNGVKTPQQIFEQLQKMRQQQQQTSPQ